MLFQYVILYFAFLFSFLVLFNELLCSKVYLRVRHYLVLWELPVQCDRWQQWDNCFFAGASSHYLTIPYHPTVPTCPTIPYYLSIVPSHSCYLVSDFRRSRQSNHHLCPTCLVKLRILTPQNALKI